MIDIQLLQTGVDVGDHERFRLRAGSVVHGYPHDKIGRFETLRGIGNRCHNYQSQESKQTGKTSSRASKF